MRQHNAMRKLKIGWNKDWPNLIVAVDEEGDDYTLECPFFDRNCSIRCAWASIRTLFTLKAEPDNKTDYFYCKDHKIGIIQK